MSSLSMSEVLDLAVDRLPPLRRRVAKFRLSASRRYRNNVLDQMCIYCCDNPECAEILGDASDGLMAGALSASDKITFDPDKLERLLQILIEYLPKLLEIILPLFMQTILVLLAFGILGSSASAQCVRDPITGQTRCQPIKAAVSTTAAVVGKTVSAVGAVITPDHVALPAQYGQTYSILELPVESQVVSTVHSSPVCSTPVSSYHGWSKSWHKVHGQPVRNAGRRLLGR